MKILAFALLITVNCFGQVNLNNGLMAYYPFSGNANDVSGNNNNPVFNNATLVADRYGNPNSAYSFNGVNNYMMIPNSPTLNFTNQLTLTAWVKVSGFYQGLCHDNIILHKGDDQVPGLYHLRFSDNIYYNHTQCSIPVPDEQHQTFEGQPTVVQVPSSNPYVQKDRWYSVVYTCDGITSKIYVNCELTMQGAGNMNFTNPYNLFFGKMNHPQYPYWFNGIMDEIRIYNRVLNTQEIAAFGQLNMSSQPIDQTVCVGLNTNFSASVPGASGYQWQVSTDGGNTWLNATSVGGSPYSNVNSTTLTVTGVTTAMNGNRYRLAATSQCGNTTSAPAILTVISPAVINTPPQDAVVCSGNNKSFTINVTGTGLTYQWQVSQDNGVNWTNISNNTVYTGTATNTLQLNNIPGGFNNNRYRVLISSGLCAAPLASSSALLTVRQTPSISLSAGLLSSLMPGQTTTLVATTSAPTGGIQTLSWTYTGCGIFSAPAGKSYIVNAEHTGNYQVGISEAFTGPAITCSAQSPVVTIDATASSRLFIFPSPNDGRFTVSYYNSGCTLTTRQILVYDAKGALVYKKQFSISNTYSYIPIDMQSASRGIYFVVVGSSTNQRLAVGKVHIR